MTKCPKCGQPGMSGPAYHPNSECSCSDKPDGEHLAFWCGRCHFTRGTPCADATDRLTGPSFKELQRNAFHAGRWGTA